MFDSCSQLMPLLSAPHSASVAVPALHALLSVTRCWVPSAGRKNGPNLIRPQGGERVGSFCWPAAGTSPAGPEFKAPLRH